jgi:hypothetical protein
MRTPAGKECRYFYGNYYRGRRQEECRLIGNAPPPHHWTPDLCKSCPVPDILRANACPHMTLRAEVHNALLGLKRSVTISAYCEYTERPVAEPEIGCGECHTLPSIFSEDTK